MPSTSHGDEVSSSAEAESSDLYRLETQNTPTSEGARAGGMVKISHMLLAIYWSTVVDLVVDPRLAYRPGIGPS